MEIKQAEFVISNTDVRKCPEGEMPEFAFIGRSNVGKSSLINMLTNHKGLAKTSSTPGKTLLINRKHLARVSAVPGKTTTVNFFSCDGVFLVDLPGYGYAQRSKTQR